MQTSNKRKPCKMCHCQQCSRYSKYKQFVINQGNRRFRRSAKHNLSGLDLSDNERFENLIISIGYTD